jgi:hypothetical protein
MAETQLNEIMATAGLFLAEFHDPSITAYNRLESRPRSQNFERSLRAEIRDPLWMLTRQWQMGELEGEDTGSAIDARLLTRQIHVDRISFNNTDGRAYSDEIPMETFVEREDIKFKEGDLARTYGLRVKMGQYFLKLHSSTLRAKYMPLYLEHFGIQANKESDFRGQTDGLNMYIATKARAIDGGKIYNAVKDNLFLSIPGIDPADATAIGDLLNLYTSWFSRLYSLPADDSDNAWHPQTLDYQFSVGAPYQNGEQEVLEANEYYSGRLDWYSFNENLASNGLSTDSNGAVEEQEEVISFLPAPAEFKGMPNPRFWEMEERQIDFGKINAKTTDHLLLLFAEFGLIYGNDWSVIPYKMRVNTICEVKGLVVTDVFGERTLIRAANEGDENVWQRWSMFNISNKDDISIYNHQFFLPSTLTHTLESEPIEKVNFIRDEMANMVWAIEDVIPDATGKGINGHEAADQTGVLPPPIIGSTADIRYLLGTSVPENWIPFLPVQKENSVQEIYFQRAAMPKLGVPPVDVVKPKGILLNEAPTPYYINEEEIPYAGTIVSITHQRARWYGGETRLWRARSRETGRGQGASNLRFDQIEALEKK